MAHSFQPWRAWTAMIAEVLHHRGYPVLATDIVSPPDAALGDLSVPFFRLAKELGKSPAELAKMAAASLAKVIDQDGASFFVQATPAGPYLNITLSDRALSELMTEVLAKETVEPGSYGHEPVHLGSPILFEYANPNTHKELHIGHLRNFVTGVAFHSLWKAAGIPVKAVQFVNDQGSNVSKTLWMMVTTAGLSVRACEMADIEELLASYPIEQRTGNALGRLYVEAGLALEGTESATVDVSWIQARLEAHDPVWERLWRETRNWCLQELQSICEEIGIVFDRQLPYLESDLLDEASSIVSALEVSGVARVSEGALIVDLEEEKLGVVLVRKSDGNLLYASKDLALAQQKARDWPAISQSYVLIDNRQSLHFKQLKSVLKRMPFPLVYDYLDYGLLTLKDGAMSSRKGNIITYQMLRNALLDRALAEVSQRHADWEPETVERTARAIAFGGMKFALLKQNADSIITFDMEQALAFEGMTGPYCQYAVVRLRSILEKGGAVTLSESAEDATEWLPAERTLAIMTAKLPSIVQSAAGQMAENINVKETQPAVLAQWAFAMAQAVNAFYRDVPVLDVEPSVRARRLGIARMAMTALKNALGILTIEVPDMM